MNEVDWWRGAHGDEYTKRNADADIEARADLWDNIMDDIGFTPDYDHVLEIGAGSGINLRALRYLGCRRLAGIEPNETARIILKEAGFNAYDGTTANPGRKADLVFTSGVLIHIPPDELLAACRGIYDAANRYIVAIEYFSHEPTTVDYRGRKLWKRDFGSFYLDNFPTLKALGSGFAWKRTTGLDNLNWWAFSKC